MQNTGGDQAGLFALISAGAAVISACLAGLVLVRSAEANAIAHRAVEAQTATRDNVRCRRGGVFTSQPPRQFPPPFPPFPPGVVIVVGQNVGGLPVTIAAAWVVFPGLGYEHGFPLVPTDTGELFPFPELPQVLPPRSVLQVPVTTQWFHQHLAEHREMFKEAGGSAFVLRLEDETGVQFDSPPIRVDRFHEDCPIWVQGASDPALRPPLGERLRRALRRES
jgi:hypothetical protein